MKRPLVSVVAMLAGFVTPAFAQGVILNAGIMNYDLEIMRTPVTELQGSSYSMGFEHYSANKKWIFAHEVGFARDNDFNSDVGYFSNTIGKEYDRWAVYGKFDVTTIVINGENDGYTFDAGLGVGFDLSDHVTIRFDVVRNLLYGVEYESFEKQLGVRANIGIQVRYRLADLFGSKDKKKNEQEKSQISSGSFRKYSRN